MTKLKSIQIDTKQDIDAMCQQILNQALHLIDARNGSIMLVNEELEILQIKARLGEPKPRTTEPIFAIGDSSIAGYVAETGKPYLCQNVKKDNYFAHSRSGYLSFKSLLSVPIVYNHKVIGIINADDPSENYFNEYKKKVLIEIAQQSSQPIAERIQRLTILDSLFDVGAELTKLPTTGGVEVVLEKITQAAVESLDVDLVTLYQYDQDRDVFLVEGTGPSIAGKLNYGQHMRTRVYKGDVPWTVIKERMSGFYPDISEQGFLTGDVERPGQKERPRFVEREKIKSMAALLLPYRAAKVSNEEVVGVMFANYRTSHEFTADEQKILATFADFAAVAIQNIRYEEKRASEQISLVHSITASFAHRMSNMAGTIPVTVQLLREKIDQKENFIHEQLNSIENDTKLLLALSKRLSKSFRKEDVLGEISSVNVNSLLNNTITQAQHRTRTVKVMSNFSPKLPEVFTSESQLEDVFDNIIMNALEAMENEDNPRLNVNTILNNKTQRIEVEITNNGPNISNDVQSKLFTFGVTTKKEKALGLGLWMCRTYMRAIGGDVLLSSNKPTTFRVIIPQRYRRDISFVESENLKVNFDVLVVEDTPIWRNKILDILKSFNHSVQVASNYSEAKEALKSYKFKLAILDIKLIDTPSNVDGLELIDEIEKTSSSTNFLIVTGYQTEEYKKTAQRSGRFIDFISKDEFDLNRFRKAIERGLQGMPTF